MGASLKSAKCELVNLNYPKTGFAEQSSRSIAFLELRLNLNEYFVASEITGIGWRRKTHTLSNNVASRCIVNNYLRQ